MTDLDARHRHEPGYTCRCGHTAPVEGGVGRPRTVEREVDPLVVELRRERRRLGLSQTEVAQRMGLTTYSTICEHERGVNQPSLALLRRWSAALGCALAIRLEHIEEEAPSDA